MLGSGIKSFGCSGIEGLIKTQGQKTQAQKCPPFQKPNPKRWAPGERLRVWSGMHHLTAARRRRLYCQTRRQWRRSEEHTSELQSQSNLVCRLLLEKKKNNTSPTRCLHRTSHSTAIT